MGKSELAFTANKNQVATPWHITRFLAELLKIAGKRVMDPTAGNGQMLTLVTPGMEYGVELSIEPYMELCKRYENGHFLNGSLFDSADFIEQTAPEIVLMNPPFNCPKEGMGDEYIKRYGSKGEDSTKGLYFVEWMARHMESGTIAALVPLGALGTKKALVECKRRILDRCTLRYSIKLAGDLFYPAAAVTVAVLVLDVGRPHEGTTYFADFSDDGLEQKRNVGRVDVSGKWPETLKTWLSICQEKPEHQYQNEGGETPGENKAVTAESDWSPSTVISIDKKALIPTTEDFKKVVRDYMQWKINQVGLEEYLRQHPELLPPPEVQLRQTIKKIEELSANCMRLVAEIEAKNEKKAKG